MFASIDSLICSNSMPSCCQKPESSATSTARLRFPEMRLYGTHRCTFFGAAPFARACLARNSMNAVVSGLAVRSGRTSGSVR